MGRGWRVFFGWFQRWAQWNNSKLRNNATQSPYYLSLSISLSISLSHSLPLTHSAECRLAPSTHSPIHRDLLHSISANLFVSGWLSAKPKWKANHCIKARRHVLQSVSLYFTLTGHFITYVFIVIPVCLETVAHGFTLFVLVMLSSCGTFHWQTVQNWALHAPCHLWTERLSMVVPLNGGKSFGHSDLMFSGN